MTQSSTGSRTREFWAGFVVTAPLPLLPFLLDAEEATQDLLRVLGLALLAVGLGLLVNRRGRALGAGLVLGSVAGVVFFYAFLVLVVVPHVS